MLQKLLYIFSIIIITAGANLQAQELNDSYLWLEEVDGVKALDWVKQHDAVTVEKLQKYPGFESLQNKSLEILNSKGRIAMPTLHGEHIYNFWMDAVNERGLWRRSILQSYLSGTPDWETIIDIDALARDEKEKWVYKGADFLYPENKKCLVFLSIGGGDATVVREFDLVKKEFIKNGFYLPEAKNNVSWMNENTLYLGTNFGEGSMTESGYPRITKLWKRGTKISEAVTLFEGEVKDVSVSAYAVNTPERQYQFVDRGLDFFSSLRYTVIDGKLKPFEIQKDAEFNGIFKNQILIQLKSDWNIDGKNFLQGSLLGIDYDKFLAGDRNFAVIIRPEPRASIGTISTTKNYLLVKMLNNVSAELYRYTFENSNWNKQKVDAPAFGDIAVVAADDFSDKYFYTYRSFLSPTTLYFADDMGAMQKLKSLPGFFETGNLKVEQHEAVSKDGTKIPYFLVSSKDLKLTGDQPTLILAYGGFEVSYQPFYSGTIGANWLEKGGVFVLANLRGGGEFGPQWHLSAIKQNRQKVNDDLIAVSEDVISRKITSPKHLGIQGGSNGGLLVGSVYLQRPDLYNAILCQVPLLDMKRYNKLLAGASWVGEYGNPDVAEEWEYISKYSPYQNIKKDQKYPPVFLITSTRDDRVHPGHARKMGAKLEEMGHPFFYYENTEGGHGAGVTNKQIAFETALTYSYLWMQLGNK
ncbi:MAG: S9 family peptidase [Ignavibacteriales bacterium]|nr:S9 family peptidase [Ignavibacteriales bacterium]